MRRGPAAAHQDHRRPKEVCMSNSSAETLLPLVEPRPNGNRELIGKLSDLREVALDILKKFDWLPTLLTRLFVGYFFFETGWAKVHNLPTFTQRFMEWGIPYPAFNAALSA